MTARFLVNDDGSPFESAEIRTLRETLDSLSDQDRENYRNGNSDAIAKHSAVKFLIVSGPGTGKSHLFLARIRDWYCRDPDARIIVTSFVRKLVADLQSDIDTKLTADQNRKITASTLHKYARSIVERNRGTTEQPLGPHFRIIGQSWKKIVWADVLAFHSSIDRSVYTWKKFEEQLHNNRFEDFDEWRALKETYFELCQFYNAAGFSDLILRAADALAENPALNDSDYFIIDEYQDFNLAEEVLIKQLVASPKGLLIVGDDEQVLYEKLKSGKPTLIRSLYGSSDYANGMLPFCGRSSYHITKTADQFIRQHREDDCIEKIYLPLKRDSDDVKVQVIACAAPTTAFDYIEKFVDDNKPEITERKKQLESGDEKDAYLLILSPSKEVRFFVTKKFDGKEKLDDLIAEYQAETRSFSEDYYKLLTYYSLANNSKSNFTFRKVLHYENVSEARTHEFTAEALKDGKGIQELDAQEIADALSTSADIMAILDGEDAIAEKLKQICSLISVANEEQLRDEMEREAASEEEVGRLEHEEEEEAELEEIEVKRMGAVELLTIVGSKGLSADHVIIIGFDNVNMNWVTKNAFYVAMTRARKSLHILTSLKSGGSRQAHDFLDQLSDTHVEYHSYKKSGHSKNPLSGKQGFKDYLDRLNAATRRR